MYGMIVRHIALNTSLNPPLPLKTAPTVVRIPASIKFVITKINTPVTNEEYTISANEYPEGYLEPFIVINELLKPPIIPTYNEY